MSNTLISTNREIRASLLAYGKCRLLPVRHVLHCNAFNSHSTGSKVVHYHVHEAMPPHLDWSASLIKLSSYVTVHHPAIQVLLMLQDVSVDVYSDVKQTNIFLLYYFLHTGFLQLRFLTRKTST